MLAVDVRMHTIMHTKRTTFFSAILILPTASMENRRKKKRTTLTMEHETIQKAKEHNICISHIAEKATQKEIRRKEKGGEK